jgi:hypothetical protein
VALHDLLQPAEPQQLGKPKQAEDLEELRGVATGGLFAIDGCYGLHSVGDWQARDDINGQPASGVGARNRRRAHLERSVAVKAGADWWHAMAQDARWSGRAVHTGS